MVGWLDVSKEMLCVVHIGGVGGHEWGSDWKALGLCGGLKVAWETFNTCYCSFGIIINIIESSSFGV